MNHHEERTPDLPPLQIGRGNWWLIFAGAFCWGLLLAKETGAPGAFYAFQTLRGVIFAPLFGLVAKSRSNFRRVSVIVLFVLSGVATRRHWEFSPHDCQDLLGLQEVALVTAGIALFQVCRAHRLFSRNPR